jgi:hypothetical protein
MKWTSVDSHGLDVVLKPLANRRVFHALKKLQDGSLGLAQSSILSSGFHTPGISRRLESLKALLFTARKPFGGFCELGGSAKWL